MFGLTQLRQGEEIGRVGRHLRLTDHDRSSCTGRIAAESTEESRGEADIMALEGPELTLINEKHPSGRVTPAASKPVEERRRARFGDMSREKVTAADALSMSCYAESRGGFLSSPTPSRTKPTARTIAPT